MRAMLLMAFFGGSLAFVLAMVLLRTELSSRQVCGRAGCDGWVKDGACLRCGRVTA